MSKSNVPSSAVIAASNICKLIDQFDGGNQSAAARRCQIPQRSLNRIVGGTEGFTLKLLESIAAAYGFKSSQLLVKDFDPRNSVDLGMAMASKQNGNPASALGLDVGGLMDGTSPLVANAPNRRIAPAMTTPISSASLDLSGLSDLQVACAKTLLGLMHKGTIQDKECVELLGQWQRHL